MFSPDMPYRMTTRRRLGATTPLALAALCLATTARAENIQHFEPAPGPSGGFSLEDHRTPGHLRLTADVYANYGSKPLVVVDASGRNELPVVEHLTTFDLIAGLTLLDRLLFAIDLPITHIAGEGAQIEDQEGLSLGDLRVMLRGRILGGDEGAGLALALPVSFETGNEFGHTSAGATILHPKLIGGYDFGALDVFANLGARIPTETDTIDGTSTKVASTATYVVGVGYQLATVRLLGEAYGAVPFEDAASKKTANPLEALFGARWAFLPGLHLNAGAGLGIIGDAGTPAFRALLGIGYQSPGSEGAPEVEASAEVAAAPPTAAPAPDLPAPMPASESVAPVDEPLYAEAGEQEADEAEERREYRARRKAREARAAGEGEAVPSTPPAVASDDDADARAARAQKDLDDEPPPNHGKKRREARPVEPAPEPEDRPPPRRDPPKREPAAAEPDDDGGIQRAPRGRLLPLGHEGVGAGKKGGHKKRPSIFFGENVTTLDKRAAGELGRVAALLDEAPAGAKIRLSGHSDDANPGDVSLRQSRRRAEAAKIWLVEHGVPAERIVLEWYGDTAPIGKNKTTAGRSVNRRVDWAFVVIAE
jgi:OOP family OmpA-OmpF porin